MNWIPAKAGIQKWGIPKHLPELIERLQKYQITYQNIINFPYHPNQKKSINKSYSSSRIQEFKGSEIQRSPE